MIIIGDFEMTEEEVAAEGQAVAASLENTNKQHREQRKDRE